MRAAVGGADGSEADRELESSLMLRHDGYQMVARDECSPYTAADHGPSGPHRYAMYGEIVSSDFVLPVTPVDDPAAEPATWSFERAGDEADVPGWPGQIVLRRSCGCPVHQGAEVTRITRGAEGVQFWYDRAGVCLVPPNPRRVAVYPSPDCDVRLLQQVLVGIVGTFVLTELGQPCLHASAVVTEQGTIAFLGPSGQGKSTMAAAFLQHGAAMLADDVLPLEPVGQAVWAKPGVPFMKIWDPTAWGSLQLDQRLPSLSTHVHKRRLDLAGRFAFVDSAQQLRAIYVLQRLDGESDDGLDTEVCAVERVSPTEGMLALLGSTLNREILSSPENRLLLAVYRQLLAQTGVYRLRYRDGFDHQRRVCERVLEHLEAM